MGIYYSNSTFVRFERIESLFKNRELGTLFELLNKAKNLLWFTIQFFRLLLLPISASSVQVWWSLVCFRYFSSSGDFDEDDCCSGNIQVLSVILYLRFDFSISSFKSFQVNFATYRTKHEEFRAIWIKASIKENDYVQCSKLRSNLFSEDICDVISESTSLIEWYDTSFNSRFAS